MILEARTTKSLEQIDQALREAAANQKFGVIAVHDLRQTMKNKGVEYGSTCIVYEVCNPHQAKRALEANPAISTVLPCRISVYGDGDGYRVATVAPAALLSMFGAEGLRAVAEEVEQAMTAIVQAAASTGRPSAG